MHNLNMHKIQYVLCINQKYFFRGGGILLKKKLKKQLIIGSTIIPQNKNMGAKSNVIIACEFDFFYFLLSQIQLVDEK